MRNIFFGILIGIFSTISLLNFNNINTACEHSNSNNTTIVAGGTFNDDINDNSIDKKFLFLDGTLRLGDIKDYQKKHLLWENQIIFTTNQLSKYLNSDDYMKLQLTNEIFFSYSDNTFSLEKELFYTSTEYNLGRSIAQVIVYCTFHNNFISSKTLLDNQDILFFIPDYEITDKNNEVIIIESRENIDNLDELPNIEDIIQIGFDVVQKNLIEKTEHIKIHQLGGEVFNGVKYITYAQTDSNYNARIATYYLNIETNKVYLFQAIYTNDSQFDILISIEG